MLRRLGLAKAPANGTNGEGKDATTVVSRPDPYVQTRFFKVVYPGRVAVRSNPAQKAPEDGQVCDDARCMGAWCMYSIVVVGIPLQNELSTEHGVCCVGCYFFAACRAEPTC